MRTYAVIAIVLILGTLLNFFSMVAVVVIAAALGAYAVFKHVQGMFSRSFKPK